MDGPLLDGELDRASTELEIASTCGAALIMFWADPDWCEIDLLGLAQRLTVRKRSRGCKTSGRDASRA